MFLKGYSERFTLKDPESNDIKPLTRYRITTGEGNVIEGTSDAAGKTSPINTAMPTSIQIDFPDELSEKGPGF